MFKKLLFSLLVLPLLFGSLSFNVVSAEEQELLTQDEIIQRFEGISAKYEIGEPLSDEDAKFVEKYAKKAPKPGGIQPRTNYQKSFSKSASNGGTTVTAGGTVWNDVNIINHTFGGSWSVNLSGTKAKEVTNTLRVVCYGLGWDGKPFVSFQDSLTSTKTDVNGKISYDSFNKSRSYNAQVTYFYEYVEVDVLNSAGARIQIKYSY